MTLVCCRYQLWMMTVALMELCPIALSKGLVTSILIAALASSPWPLTLTARKMCPSRLGWCSGLSVSIALCFLFIEGDADHEFVSHWISIPATCTVYLRDGLLIQFCVLPHRDRSCRLNLLSRPVSVYWHWGQPFQAPTVWHQSLEW